MSYKRNKDKDGHADGFEDITMCYFTNILEDIKLLEAEAKFSRLKGLVDILAPKKKNKQGKSFGFASFVGVTAERWIEEKLRNMWFGAYKVPTC